MKKFSTEKFQFLQIKKNLHITWACFHHDDVYEFQPITDSLLLTNKVSCICVLGPKVIFLFILISAEIKTLKNVNTGISRLSIYQ